MENEAKSEISIRSERWLKIVRIGGMAVFTFSLIFALLNTAGFLKYLVIASSLDDIPESRAVMQGLSENMKAPLILDIAFPEHGVCPKRYVRKDLGYWPGVRKGCLCRNSEGKLIETKGECPEKCTKVEEWAGKPLYTWRGVTLCIRYTSSELYKTGTDCPKGYIACNPLICVNKAKDKSCPVTDFKILPWSTPLAKNTTELPLNFTHRIRLIRNYEQSPLVDISITLGDKVCVVPDLKLKRTVPAYPLLEPSEYYKKETNGCERFGVDESNDHSVVDVSEEDAILRENRAIAEDPKHYEEFARGQLVSLYATRVYGIKDDPQCLMVADYFSRKKTTTVPIPLRSSASAICGFAAGIIGLLGFLVEGVMRKTMKHDRGSLAWAYIIFIGTSAVLLVASEVFYFITDRWVFAATNLIQELTHADCFKNDKLNLVFDIIEDNIIIDYHRYYKNYGVIFLAPAACILFVLAVVAKIYIIKNDDHEGLTHSTTEMSIQHAGTGSHH